MRRKTFWYGVCGVLLLATVGCGDKIEPGNNRNGAVKTVQARVAVATVDPQRSFYEAVGTVGARTSSTLSSKIMGAVRAVHVKEGDRVEEGRLLVELDDRQAQSQQRGARAALDEARRALASAESGREAAAAGAELAKTTYDRYQNLLKEESVSRQEFDEIAARYRQATAALSQAGAMAEAARDRVQQAEAGLESAATNLKEATIRAPYQGKITAKMVDVGDMASPGTPLLSMEREGVFCVSLVVPEIHIRAVALGDKVNVTIPSMDNLTVQGTVGRIDPDADPQSRSFVVKVALPEGHAFRSGVFARVALPVGESGMLLVPKTALVQRGQLTGFYLLDEENIARFRLLRVGREAGEHVEVISGLRNGDRYLTQPPPDMADGARVEVVP